MEKICARCLTAPISPPKIAAMFKRLPIRQPGLRNTCGGRNPSAFHARLAAMCDEQVFTRASDRGGLRP
jgi:hypothetical protein